MVQTFSKQLELDEPDISMLNDELNETLEDELK